MTPLPHCPEPISAPLQQIWTQNNFSSSKGQQSEFLWRQDTERIPAGQNSLV